MREAQWKESGRSIPIKEKVQILIIGAGPAGIAAAVSSARMGHDVLLVERFHRLGGMSTGGEVLLFDDMANDNEKVINGLCDEVVFRLRKMGGAIIPDEADLYISSHFVYQHWRRWGFENMYSKKKPRSIVYSVAVDPESLAFVFNQLIMENKVKVKFGALFCEPILEEGKIIGGIFESKAGRYAILADMVIDASGDGDVFAKAGVPFTMGKYMISMIHRFANVDTAKTEKWEQECPSEAAEINRELRSIYGGSWHDWWLKTPLEGVVWCNCPHFPEHNGLNDDELTNVVFEGRERIAQAQSYIKQNVPGFEKAVLIDTASQIGVRQTRLLKGEYILTKEDILNHRQFYDCIGRARDYYYPYRCLLPQKIENLIVAGRCFSATSQAQRISREIPAMFVLGQAAGVAAALACQEKSSLRKLDVEKLQSSLKFQGVNLGPVMKNKEKEAVL